MSKNLMLSLLAFAGDKPAAGAAAAADIAAGAAGAMLASDFSLFVDTGREMPRKGRVAGVVGPLLSVAEMVLRAYVGGLTCPVVGPAAPAGTGNAIASLWATLPTGETLPCHSRGKKTDAQRDAVRPYAHTFASVFSSLVTEGVKAVADAASAKLKAGKASRDEVKATAATAAASAAAAAAADTLSGAIRSAGAADLIRALGMFDAENIGAGAGADGEAFEHLVQLLSGVATQRAAAVTAAAMSIIAAADAAVAAAAAAAQSVIDCNIAGSTDGARAVGDQYEEGKAVAA